MAAPVTAPGIGSGLDVQSIVKAMVEADSQPLKNLQNQQKETNASLSAYGTLNSALMTYQNAMRDLYSGTSVPLSVQSSDDKVATATVSRAATPGQHDIEVKQAAIAQQLRSKTAYRSPEAKVGSGILRIAIDGKSFNVRIKRGNNTLAGIADAINAAPSNPGISASVITSQDGASLVLNVNDRFKRAATLSERLPAFIKQDGKIATALQNAETAAANLGNQLFPRHAKGKTPVRAALTKVLQSPPLLSQVANRVIDQGLLTGGKERRIARLERKGKQNKAAYLQKRADRTQQVAHNLVKTIDQPVAKLKSQAAGILLKHNPAAAPQITVKAIGGPGLSKLADFQEVKKPQKAVVLIDGVEVQSDSNTITDGVSGLTVNVKTPGKTTITVTGDNKAMQDAAKKFVDSYNALQKAITQAQKDLGGTYDTTLTSIQSSLRGVLNTPPPPEKTSALQDVVQRLPQGIQDQLPPALTQSGFGPRKTQGSLYRLPAEIGITLQKDGSLSLDTTKLNDALGKDFQGVSRLLLGATDQSAPYRLNQAVMNLTATDGALGSKTKSLQDENGRLLQQMADEQTRIQQRQDQYYQQFAELDKTVAAMQQSSNALAQVSTQTSGNPVTSLIS